MQTSEPGGGQGGTQWTDPVGPGDRTDAPADTQDLDEIRQALEDSEKVDATRIEVGVDGTTVVLRGSVSDSSQGHLAELLVGHYASDIRNELRVDAGFREGADEPQPVEEAIPAEGEILIGSTDMLAGPNATATSDVARALEENEPWDPPDEPSLASTPAELRGTSGFGDGGPVDEIGSSALGGAVEIDGDAAAEELPAAADLTQQDLEASARGAAPPSIDETAVPARDVAEPDPVGRDPFGHTPPEGADEFPSMVPGTEPGLGGVGEGTAGGGSVSGVPATETGSLGADTAAADPARSTGGTMTDAGTERGPQAREDPPLREDFPDPE
ncbi:MAG TPA: BON domain-containing protein [Actinomycetota bacterium]|nr:BON domain-containing protein [Actinomycetota bacterium]